MCSGSPITVSGGLAEITEGQALNLPENTSLEIRTPDALPLQERGVEQRNLRSESSISAGDKWGSSGRVVVFTVLRTVLWPQGKKKCANISAQSGGSVLKARALLFRTASFDVLFRRKLDQ